MDYLAVQYTSLSGATLSGSLVYDNNGNLIQNSKYKFSYDYKNRLVKVTNISGTGIIAEFKYDVLGRRYEKKTSLETVNYVYSDKNILSEYKTESGKVLKKDYINGLGIDNVIAFESEENGLSTVEKEELSFCNSNVLTNTGGFVQYGWQTIVDRCESLSNSGSLVGTNRYYLHKNHLGSIVGITNNSGTFVTEYDYDVFGKASIISGSDIGNTILFTGREYDKEIGLYYFRARYYDAELGRFINRDPIGQVDDVNLYGYVGNNGVMFVDNLGLEKQLQEDIKNGNTFVIELVSRRIDIAGIGGLGVHTFIMIYSMDNNNKVNKYSMGAYYNSDTGKLEGMFNKSSDIGWKDDTKGSIIIKSPNGMKSSEFANNIYNEFNKYNKNQKDYRGTGEISIYDNAGNCNNFTLVLYIMRVIKIMKY